jgi:hypothetical protein
MFVLLHAKKFFFFQHLQPDKEGIEVESELNSKRPTTTRATNDLFTFYFACLQSPQQALTPVNAAEGFPIDETQKLFNKLHVPIGKNQCMLFENIPQIW